MSPKEFKKALAALCMTQIEFADIMGLSPRTVRGYASAGVTRHTVVIAIYLMLASETNRRLIETIRRR